MGLLVPDYIFQDVTHITIDFLAKRGIKGLVLDVDNTLTMHSSQELDTEISFWLEQMKANGILLSIASNNYKKRVAPFAEKIGVEHVSFACKPLPSGLIKIRKKWGLERKEMALVGDQIFTDGLAAGFYGITMLLVKPIAQDTHRTIRLKRKLEAPIIMQYYKRGGKLL